MNILHFDKFYFSSKNQKIIITATVYFEKAKGVVSEGEIEDFKKIVFVLKQGDKVVILCQRK